MASARDEQRQPVRRLRCLNAAGYDASTPAGTGCGTEKKLNFGADDRRPGIVTVRWPDLEVSGGRTWDRTTDPFHVKEVLSR